MEIPPLEEEGFRLVKWFIWSHTVVKVVNGTYTALLPLAEAVAQQQLPIPTSSPADLLLCSLGVFSLQFLTSPFLITLPGFVDHTEKILLG